MAHYPTTTQHRWMGAYGMLHTEIKQIVSIHSIIDGANIPQMTCHPARLDRTHWRVSKMELMADLNFLLALKTRIRCKLSPSWLSASSSSPLITHGCSNACFAVMRSDGSTVNILDHYVAPSRRSRRTHVASEPEMSATRSKAQPEATVFDEEQSPLEAHSPRLTSGRQMTSFRRPF